MASKRMFNKEITNSDHFLDMPLTTQALYFHLGMNADDDGFVSPKSILRLIQAKDDDLRVLIAKGFVISFQESVIVITHWKINNELKSDRIKPTIYQEHLATLGLENKVYKPMSPKCLQNVSIDKYSIVENSIDYIDSSISLETDKPKKENNTIKNIDAKFEEFRNIYPNKKGKANARILWAKIKGVDYDVIINACKLFAIENKGQDIKYIKHGNTWLSQQCWEDYKTIDREALKREMYNTWHEDTEDEPNTAHGKNMKDKYMLFGENWYDIRMEDKQEVKYKKKEERLLARSQPTQG